MRSWFKTLTSLAALGAALWMAAPARALDTIGFDDKPVGTPIYTQYGPSVYFYTRAAGSSAIDYTYIYKPRDGSASDPNGLSAGRSDGISNHQYMVMDFTPVQKEVNFFVGPSLRASYLRTRYVIRAKRADGALLSTQTINFSPLGGSNGLELIWKPVKVKSKTFDIRFVEVECLVQEPDGAYLTGGVELIDGLTYRKDVTPPVAIISNPTFLSTVCGPQTPIYGTANDPEGFDSYKLEWAQATAETPTSWNLIVESSTPVVNGLLGTWDNSSITTSGYYLLKLTVTNAEGDKDVAIQPVYVDRSFETVQVAYPTSGQILGGASVCITGTVYDYSMKRYKVEYAKSGSSSYQPVDPANPWYYSTAINTTLATWKTTGVSDGTYVIRVTGEDICGHTKSESLKVVVDNTIPVAEITEPKNCMTVNGLVPVKGVVKDDNLHSWILEYTGGSVNGWVTIASGTGNISGTLGVWDTTSLPSCNYTLRLRAFDKSAQNCSGYTLQSPDYNVSVKVGLEGDLNNDGCVDDFDLFILTQQFLTCR